MGLFHSLTYDLQCNTDYLKQQHVFVVPHDYLVFISSGPAECLFEQPYYEKMKKALRPGGVLCAQGNMTYGGGGRVILGLVASGRYNFIV